ncbi:hypothetical protein ABQ348_22065, partial [Serratia fonticola]
QQEVDGELCHVVPGDSFKKLSDALDEIENTLPDEYEDLPNTVLQWAAVPRHALRAMLQPVSQGCKLPFGVVPIQWIGVDMAKKMYPAPKGGDDE